MTAKPVMTTATIQPRFVNMFNRRRRHERRLKMRMGLEGPFMVQTETSSLAAACFYRAPMA